MHDDEAPAGIRGWWHRLTQPWPLPAFTVPGEFGVELQDAGDRTVEVVRAIRRMTGWSLVSAKHATESTPVMLTLGVSRGSADNASRVLAEAGAVSRVVRTVDA